MDSQKHNGNCIPKENREFDSDQEENIGKTRVLVHQDAMDLPEELSRKDYSSGDRPSYFADKCTKICASHVIEPDDLITPLSEDSNPDKTHHWEKKPSVEPENNSIIYFKVLFPCFGDLIDPCSMTIGHFLGLIISFSLYTGNIVSNIIVCYHLFLHGNMLWFALVTAFTIIPTVILNAVSYHISISKMVKKSIDQPESIAVSVIIALLHLSQFGIFARYLGYLFLHELEYLWLVFCPNKKRKDYDCQSGKYAELPYLPYLFMIEAMLQCLPHLLCQIYILIEGQDILSDDTVKVLAVSIAVSMLNLSRLLTLTNHTQKNFSTSWSGLVFMFLWYFFTSISRIISFALFMTKFTLAFLILCLCHWIILSIWSVKVLTSPIAINTCQGFFQNVWKYIKGFIVGVTYLLCFMELKITSNSHEPSIPTRYLYSFYYSVIFLENSVLIVLWFIFNVETWYSIPAVILTFASFFIGLFFMYIYYRYFHKNVIFHSSRWKCIFMFPVRNQII